MAYLRAYQALSNGLLPGRGPRAGDPFIGGLIGRVGGLVLPGVGKVVRKGVSKVLGKRNLPQVVKKVGKVAGGFGTVVGGGVAVERITRPGGMFGPNGGGRRYRRINPANVKALRRAIRRVDGFTKLARKVGYVKKRPYAMAKRSKR